MTRHSTMQGAIACGIALMLLGSPAGAQVAPKPPIGAAEARAAPGTPQPDKGLNERAQREADERDRRRERRMRGVMGSICSRC